MMESKKLRVVACAIGALAVASLAVADPVTITNVDGTWKDSVLAGGGEATINNAGTPRTARWGEPVSGNIQSGYDFTPNNPGTVDVDGANFLLGTFVHQNLPVFPPSLTSIKLAFSLTWSDFAPDLAGDFLFDHDETPNGLNPCPYGGANLQGVNINGCADRVLISSPFLNTLITDGTSTYFFTLLGFSTDGGVTTSNQFVTIEDAINTAGLYGRLTSVPIQVPEPVSLLLVGAGLLGIAVRSRRR